MRQIWHRWVNKKQQKKCLAPKKIHADIVATLRDDASALSTVQYWAAEFWRGRKSLEYDPIYGGHETATNEEEIDCVHQIVMDDEVIDNKSNSQCY